MNKGIQNVECIEEHAGSLRDRMKTYENSVGSTLDRSYPVLVRVNAKLNMDVEYADLMNASVHACKTLLWETPGAKIAYGNSDEITMMFADYLGDALWLGGKTQKIASNAASIVTDSFKERMDLLGLRRPKKLRFYAKCFNIPFAEVNNYFIWRQSTKGTGYAFKKTEEGWDTDVTPVDFKKDRSYVNSLIENNLTI
jgi:hypothetical protein